MLAGVRTALLGAAGPYAGFDVALDFKNGIYRVGGQVTRDVSTIPGYVFGRSGALKYELNSAGVLVPVAPNVPYIQPGVGFWSRPVYNNSMQNSNFIGGVSGTPGTLPTGWGSFGMTNNGFTRTLSYGTDPVTGLNYVDIRLAGTDTSNSNQYFSFFASEANGNTATVQNDVWTMSVTGAIIAGSNAGFINNNGPYIMVEELNATGGSLGGTPGSVLQNNDPVLKRRSVTRTVLSADAVRVRLQFRAITGPGATIDCTFRMMAPQALKGTSAAGPYIPTSATGLAGIGSDQMMIPASGPKDEDWVLFASTNYQQPAIQNLANVRSLKVHDVPSGNNVTNQIQLYRNNNSTGNFNVNMVVNGAAPMYPGGAGQAGPGRNQMALRHIASTQLFDIAVRVAGVDGVAFGSQKVTMAMPANLNYFFVGGTGQEAPDSPVEFVGYRRGTYDNTTLANALTSLGTI